jgi:uncharacterized membrane protein (UPF0127 family)
MQLFASLAAVLVLVTLASCGDKPAASTEDFATRDVTLPGGQVIHVETRMDVLDMMRGMMFRTSLAPDRGMLFVHRAPSRYPYFMFQTLIPLDIIWMDQNRTIVEMFENAPPCKREASQCPHYGGNQDAKYVIEIGGGMAKKYGLKVGDRLDF